MNKKLFFLASTLLLVPACKKGPRYTKKTKQTCPTTAAVERVEYDDELGAFVVKEDDNTFSSAVAAQTQEEEELESRASDLKSGDLQADSAKYGLKPIYFEFNKYKLGDLQPDQKPILSHNLSIIKSLADKGYRISVEGHACDSAGSTEYNMMLSEDRAKAVKEMLEKEGVSGEIHFVGHGCEHLIVQSGDRKQQAPNRRVEIYAYLP